MNKSNKRMLLIPVTLAIAVTLASGCSKSSDQSKNSDQKDVTITTARVVGADVTFKNGESTDENVHTRWAKDTLGITLKNDWTVGTGDAYTTKLRLLLNSNQKLPDVFRVSDKIFESQLIDSGAVMDITKSFDQYASERLKKLFADNPQLWYTVTHDGKHYGLPVTNAISSPEVLWIRQDWLNKLNLKAPTNIDEMEKVMDAFVNQDPDGNGKKDTIGLSVSLKNGIGSNLASTDFIFGHTAIPGSWNVDGSGALAYGSVQPTVKEGLTRMANWMKKGYLDPDAGTVDDSKASESFVQGKSGMIVGPVWMPEWPFGDVKFEYKAVPLPKGVDGKVGFRQEEISSVRLYFSSDFKYMKQFFEYLDKIMGPGFYDTTSEFANGWAENYDYIMKDGKPVYDVKQIPGGTASVKKYNLFWNDIQTPGKELEVMAKLGTGAAPTTPYELYFAQRPKRWAEASAVLKTYHDQGVNNEFIGPPTATQVQKGELLLKLENETFLKVIYGNVSPDTFDEFVASWRNSGGDAVTKEVNQWYTSVKK